MSMTARNIKWAVSGFVGGFLFCYLLIGAFQSQRAASPLLAKATPAVAWPQAPVIATVPTVLVTNLGLSELHIESPPRWLGPGLPPPRVSNPNYSLDLIDTHYQTPKRPPEP
jgi:hypothetical protein